MTLNIQNNSVHFMFSTPVLQMDWPFADKYNPQLRALIIDIQASSESRHLSNEGGWQSDDNLFKLEAECITALNKWVRRCINHIYEVHHHGTFEKGLREAHLKPDFQMNAWANVNKHGNSNTIHNHPACLWSGVYYVSAQNDSGSVAFLDPRLSANMNNIGNEMIDIFKENVKYVAPREGLTVIFPSWVQHFVSQNQAMEDRISIAFNSKITLKPL